MMRRNRDRLRRCALAAGLLTVLLLPCLADTRSGTKMVPETVRLEIAATRQVVTLSKPSYLAPSVEETPYQWLQLCDAAGTCSTLADLRGSGGVSVPRNPALAFSPDQRFLLCLRMTAVDPAARTYRSQSYEIYDLAAGRPVSFRTAAGKTATADNILGWSAQHPHALEMSAGHKKRALAFAPGDR